MDSRRWALVLCVVSAFGGCVPEYTPAPGAEDDAPTQANDVSEYDPFAGDVPTLIFDALLQQMDDRLLDIDIQRQLFEYGRANTMDPRPWLLLARDSMARNWAGFAVRQYGLALRADVRVSRVTDVLTDVLQIAVDYTGVEESDANALLQEHWGLAALPAIDRARARMVAEGHAQAASKLTAMRETLIAQAQ